MPARTSARLSRNDEGETLRQRVEKGALSVREAIDLTVQLCEGLDKAHRSGIVHRDIKPDNLILTSDGILKIVDFGIAKLLGGQGRTQPGAVVGTPAYMAPEQIKGEDVDVRADIWATGVTLFYMLCAQLPFRGDSDLGLMYSIVHEPPLSVRDLRGGVPEQLEAVVLRALAKEAAQRYPSVGEMLRDLKGDQTAATMPAVREPVAEAAAPTLSSLAVMTFKDLSPARDQASLCEGLSEASRLWRSPEHRMWPLIQHTFAVGMSGIDGASTRSNEASSPSPKPSILTRNSRRLWQDLQIRMPSSGFTVPIRQARSWSAPETRRCAPWK
ncbi:MAG: serine/threonine-protein kinase [Acidobacteriota bacterium]